MVHPDKTRLVDFRSPAHSDRRYGNGNDAGRPKTFDLLGFTHFWGKTYKGNWVVRRKTMKSRLARSIQKIDQLCRSHRHMPIGEQWKKLCEKVRGHYSYYGITGNHRSLGKFLVQVQRSWRRWLDRRTNKWKLTWEKFQCILKRCPLPVPNIAHSIFKRK